MQEEELVFLLPDEEDGADNVHSSSRSGWQVEAAQASPSANTQSHDPPGKNTRSRDGAIADAVALSNQRKLICKRGKVALRLGGCQKGRPSTRSDESRAADEAARGLQQHNCKISELSEVAQSLTISQ